MRPVITIPVHWKEYALRGNPYGLVDEEIQTIDKTLADSGEGVFTVEAVGPSYFGRWYDRFNMAWVSGMVQDISIKVD